MSHRTFSCVATILLAATGAACAEIQPDFLMDSDPAFQLPETIKVFRFDYKGMWNDALARPEVDLQRMTAETIALAHKKGVPDLIETVPTLEKILMSESSHPSARFAAARALTVLESVRSSEMLFEATQKYGADLRHLVEPALAEWDFVPIRAVWSKRLDSAGTRPRDVMLAIRGLGRVRDASALSTLRKISLDTVRVPDVRLEAASAAGLLAETGLEADADRLIHETHSTQVINRHCAIRLLTRHGSEPSRQLLIELATDAEPSIAAAALERLNEIDPALVLPFAERAFANADVHVREQGARSYLSLPTTERIGPLGELLDDPHPALRRRICEGLYRLARNAELKETIIQAAMVVLARERWQGHEQASLLLGALEYQPASKRLVELLESPRTEVMINSAWGLRKIADPLTIPAIVDKIRRQTVARKTIFKLGVDDQVAHLFEACGRMQAMDAELLMIEHIPKQLILGPLSRGAAVWALGWLHVGVPNAELGIAFVGRLTDPSMMPPETELVKHMCAISLARMKAIEHVPVLKHLVGDATPNSKYGMGLQWAIKELTGEVIPGPFPRFVGPGSWFLEPLAPVDETH